MAELDLVVRHASPADIPQLAILLGQLFEQEEEFHPSLSRQSEGLRRMMENAGHGLVLVAHRGPVVSGMVTLQFTVSTALGATTALLEDMVVDAKHRRAGVGSLLLKRAVDEARRLGCARITLLTDEGNDSARRFYRRHGFVRSSMVALRRAMPARSEA